MRFSDLLKKILSECGTVTALADKIDAPLSTTRDWIEGKKIPRDSSLKLLAGHMGWNQDALIQLVQLERSLEAGLIDEKSWRRKSSELERLL